MYIHIHGAPIYRRPTSRRPTSTCNWHLLLTYVQFSNQYAFVWIFHLATASTRIGNQTAQQIRDQIEESFFSIAILNARNQYLKDNAQCLIVLRYGTVERKFIFKAISSDDPKRTTKFKATHVRHVTPM